MDSKPYIVLLDPWDYVEDDDSGWGNRIQCWEAVSILINRANTNHEIKVLSKHYPELNLVSFPNTSYIELKDIDAVPITNNMVSNWIKDSKINLNPNLSYITKFDFNYSTLINQNFYNPANDLVKSIYLKDKELNLALDKFTSNTIGIHIRRGNGVHVDSTDLASVPEGYDKYYRLCLECDEAYDFFRDEEYYSFIDSKIKEDKDVKFYLGIDVDEQAVDYYKIKYPGKIYTRGDVIKVLKDLLTKIKFLEPRLQLNTMGHILIDFFTLAKCRDIIVSPFSSWSHMGCRITGKFGTEINNLENIYEKSSIYPIKRRML